MAVYGVDEVKSKIAHIIETAHPEKGEYVYVHPANWGWCAYADLGKPSCILGHLLVQLGVPVEIMDASIEGAPMTDGIILKHWDRLAQDYNLHFTPAAREFLYIIQAEQDDQVSWGEAFKAASAYSDSI